MRHGHKSLVMDKALKESHPALYDHILEFARKNKLKIEGEDPPPPGK
jgi:hypothetical protein